MTKEGKIFDLEERTAKFAEDVIKFCQTIKETTITKPIISQLIRAATSIGANYCEADDSDSKKDFRHKISICKKEARETKHWLRMSAVALPDRKEDLKKLWCEAKELHLIFNSIYAKVK
ncbi:MAG: four helix bundle protein [Patescibacteria group bacterium]